MKAPIPDTHGSVVVAFCVILMFQLQLSCLNFHKLGSFNLALLHRRLPQLKCQDSNP
jgi:hypothetical protein